MRILLVTGTDTEVGKTVTTAALAAAMAAAGRRPYVVKPAQTGVRGEEPGDLDTVRTLVGDVPGHEGVRLVPALAPDAAARLSGRTLPSLEDQVARALEAARDHDTLIEGAGGALVRLGEDWTLLDLGSALQRAGAEVALVVVARGGLGTLNHSALTVEAARSRGLDVAGVIIGSWPDQPGTAELANLDDLPRMTGVPLLGRIPAGAGGWARPRFVGSAPSWISLPG